jgi:hypothetical protein
MDNDTPTPSSRGPHSAPPLSPSPESKPGNQASSVPLRPPPGPAPAAGTQAAPPTEQPMRPEVRISALPADGEQPAPIAVEADGDGVYRFGLECLPGADAVQLLLDLDRKPRLRAEVRARAGDVVRLEVRIDEAGEPVLRTGSNRVLFLPVGVDYDPVPPLPSPRPDAPWDICLLIDATMRHSAEAAREKPAGAESESRAQPGAGGASKTPAPAPAPSPDTIPRRDLDRFLIDQPEPWGKVVAPVVELVRGLAAAAEARIAVIAFADEPPTPGIYASDLVPRYHLRHLPAERLPYELMAISPEGLEALLIRCLTASPGMDFVDAVGDALAAARGLEWRPGSRRLVVLIGDSPGHSTADPIRYGGDALARAHDVDTEAARLHQAQAEILTIYHPPSAGARDQAKAQHRDLFDFSRDQYRRLASQPSLAFTTEGFDPKQALAVLQGRSAPLGRGACWGRLRAG